MLPPFQVLGEAIPPIQLTLAPGVDVGMIFVFAMGSIAVYGVILGGWASNNKYSFLGGLRSSAQLIAYELPLGLGILGVVLVTGSLRLDDIIHQQASTGVWNIVMQPIGFLVFMVASFAESARLPFDLPEAEQELIGGYHTEYSGLRLLLYLIAEFLHMVTASFLISILFLGGWHLWGVTGSGDEPITWVTALLRVAVLLTKVFGMIVFFMLVRWSWPRFRFDQLMSLAWKVMLPLGMVNLAIMAVVVEYHAQIMQTLGGSQAALVAVMWALAILAWVIAGLVSPLSTDNRPRLELSDRL
jgi:NADH-quinone oxidoreductase subunit H